MPAAPLLARVAVADTAFASEQLWPLPGAVFQFVDAALGAEYRSDELPEEAVRSYWLSRYLGEVDNGGHASVVTNTELPPEMRHHVRAALAALGSPEAQAIFADLLAFVDEQPARAQRCHGEYDDIDPYYFGLDDRFFALPPGRLAIAHRGWLRTRDWIEVIPERAIMALRGKHVPPHPQAAERRNARPAPPSLLAAIRDMLRRP